jgi:hypothetical protein
MCADKLHIIPIRFFISVKPLRENHETRFGILATTELNLLAKLTKSCKQRDPYI